MDTAQRTFEPLGVIAFGGLDGLVSKQGADCFDLDIIVEILDRKAVSKEMWMDKAHAGTFTTSNQHHNAQAMKGANDHNMGQSWRLAPLVILLLAKVAIGTRYHWRISAPLRQDACTIRPPWVATDLAVLNRGIDSLMNRLCGMRALRHCEHAGEALSRRAECAASGEYGGD